MVGTAGTGSEILDPSLVRDQLDEILAREITALLDVDSRDVMMSFNLLSISCITLIIEREREIRAYTDFPPERYTRDSLLKELQDIGLDIDESVEKLIDTFLEKGYFSLDEDEGLKAEMPAFMMAGFLDNMFPGMQGMNLVAFILQMNEEVNSGRKTLELAKDSFKSTLKSRGVSVSKDKAAAKASEIVEGRADKPTAVSREISRKLKKNNLNRLSKLIRRRKKRSSELTGQVKVQDVFHKPSSKEEDEAQKAEMKKAEEIARKAAELARQLAEKDEKIKEAEEAAKEAARHLEELEQREKKLLADHEEAQRIKEEASRLEELEARMAAKEAELKALEEKLRQEEQEKLRHREEEQQRAEHKNLDDEDIESKIAAFESELTMPCPLCKEGEIVSRTTEKGKDFFSCTNPECRFVSWDKPYHFECPLCKNSFLVEMTASNGEKGLKCPRAACSYTQDNLMDPKLNMARKAAAGTAPRKKKRRIVRRKRR